MTPIKAAADPSRENRAQLAYETFLAGFNPPSTLPKWEDAASWFRDAMQVGYLQGKLDGSAPAGNAGVRLSGEQCDAFIKATGEWIEPHEPATEDGHPIEMGITQEEADEFNAEAREQVRKGFAAALSLSQPREAFADEIKRAEERPTAFLAWAVDMFGPVTKLRSERLLRFVEEAIELAHAEGMERNVLNRVAERVYSRSAGDTPKEIGQAQACLETFAENIGLSSAGEAQREWERVQTIPRDEWARRHSAKQAIGIALKPQDGGESGR